MSLMTPLNAA